jgi:hypothetical protein
MKHKEQLWQISSSYFVAGALVEHGHVTAAAPVIKSMIGHKQQWVERYCRSKGWNIRVLNSGELEH